MRNEGREAVRDFAVRELADADGVEYSEENNVCVGELDVKAGPRQSGCVEIARLQREDVDKFIDGRSKILLGDEAPGSGSKLLSGRRVVGRGSGDHPRPRRFSDLIGRRAVSRRGECASRRRCVRARDNHRDRVRLSRAARRLRCAGGRAALCGNR